MAKAKQTKARADVNRYRAYINMPVGSCVVHKTGKTGPLCLITHTASMNQH